MAGSLSRLLTIAGAVACQAYGQTPPPSALTLAQAKEYALRNHPRIRSADSITQAARSVVKEVRSAKFPTVTGLATGVDAQHSTILAAGAIQTSSLYTRVASGIAVSQLITDFGRTSDLTRNASLRAEAQNDTAVAVREQVLLQVEQAYYQTLGAQAVLQAAQSAVNIRETTLRQIRALADSAMRSTLDVRFAEVALSNAQLDLYRAENEAAEAQANLAASLGLDNAPPFTVTDEPMPPALPSAPAESIQEAQRKRPELLSLDLTKEAAHRYAEAEARLNRPTVSALATAGAVPAGDPRLPGDYSAAGVNVVIPILNGGLFRARHEEAEERATAADNDARDLAIQIGRQVRIAWLEANTAFRRLDVTARLVAEANEALRLAQTRYDNGLGSIVELTQAQFNQTSAQIESAGSRYAYLASRAALDYATGDLQ